MAGLMRKRTVSKESYCSPITQAFAVTLTENGRCGDSSHSKTASVTFCAEEKAAIIFSKDASYAVVHNSLASRVTTETRPATSLSLTLLRQFQRAELAESGKLGPPPNAKLVSPVKTNSEQAKPSSTPFKKGAGGPCAPATAAPRISSHTEPDLASDSKVAGTTQVSDMGASLADADADDEWERIEEAETEDKCYVLVSKIC
ncbi:hypothetical protein BAUCODRAFT_551524 [Baudoinia panamericana UAMH 10762]|uniref:Uncharacterized protein n=1 Tax=Baudoinia panamericana (strain UAMH 10762) TaxID=717646 RepID=M2N690_BAUPA|nr:uncharacterized protein BAUCODRAFT_551524 [Baudoinia panamericana UAMH 10762]EMC94544.1 hypothetical protein BAUCODRAFT_551524 [Baudoinia panamericana UAMH 10762]